MISCATTVAGLPRAVLQPRQATWTSPDRGVGECQSPQPEPWPPLIHAALPAWMKWRDAVLTLIFVGRVRMAASAPVPARQPHCGRALGHRGLPDAAGAVCGHVRRAHRDSRRGGALTERRRQRALMLRQPTPLALSDEARGAGMDEAALAAARGLRIAVVHTKREADSGSNRDRLPPSQRIEQRAQTRPDAPRN